MDGSPRLLHEAVDHREAQAAARAELLGREERLENARDCGLVHPLAGVLDKDLDIAPRHDLKLGGFRLMNEPACAVHHKAAASGHGIAGIQHKVEEGVLELLGVYARVELEGRRLS